MYYMVVKYVYCQNTIWAEEKDLVKVASLSTERMLEYFDTGLCIVMILMGLCIDVPVKKKKGMMDTKCDIKLKQLTGYLDVLLC